MKRKKKVSTAKRLTDLHARVWMLEQVERGAANYRRALAEVRQQEVRLREARTALEQAAKVFLDPYLPLKARLGTATTAGSTLTRTYNA